MFDFFFKRSASKRSAQPASAKVPEAKTQEVDANALALQARKDALVQADKLAGDESAAADFIVQCEFADARLKAAQHVHSRQLLERVAQAMRNTDRRVVKLMQQRLDVILEQEKREQKALQCVQQAERLAQESQLMLNQVSELDRAWQSVGMVSAALQTAFDQARLLLRERLESQAALQHAVIDVRTRLQKLAQTVTETPHIMPFEQAGQALDELEQELAGHCAAREAASLPKHLLNECEQQRNELRQAIEVLGKRHAAIAAREEALAAWEATPLPELKEDVLKRTWQSLPMVHGDQMALLSARFSALMEKITPLRKAKPVTPSPKATQHDLQHFSSVLEELEKALDNGGLQAAAEHDKALRAMDLKSLRLPEAQTARLAKARSELSRLQGWAKWGGNVSREELLKTAQELPNESHSPTELAKKVGSLRARWKSLDTSAGPASRELWERFDAACSTAYAPAAEHFKKLAEERTHNLARAKSMVEEVKAFAASSNCATADAGAVDWKAVAAFCARMNQLWHRLGPIDRKEKKAIDAEFAAALQTLTGPLAAQQKSEIARREQLIAEASALDPAERSAIDKLRALQERWQERAKSLPLQRNDEQALWQRFRAACDAVFARRKETAQAADMQRQQHLETREALCETLEASIDALPEAIGTILQETAQAWNKAGPVPHAAERQIQARYQAAVKALQQRLDHAKRLAAAEEFNALHAKLALCQKMEARVVNHQAASIEELTQLQEEWERLPALSSRYERVLRPRFDAALAALQSPDQKYASLLEHNRVVLEKDILHLEIVAGLDSPPELARERLQLQVEVLQSSLKAGQKADMHDDRLVQLCKLPALTDLQLGHRIDQVIKYFKSRKVKG